MKMNDVEKLNDWHDEKLFILMNAMENRISNLYSKRNIFSFVMIRIFP
jgi:hypothetical protein